MKNIRNQYGVLAQNMNLNPDEIFIQRRVQDYGQQKQEPQQQSNDVFISSGKHTKEKRLNTMIKENQLLEALVMAEQEGNEQEVDILSKAIMEQRTAWSKS